MKKVLCCILSIILVLSVCCISFAEPGETEGLEFKCETLRALGIIPGNEHGDYGMLRDLSKNSFLAFVCNMTAELGYTEDYSDEAVVRAEELGLIHKNQTDLHKPISYDEAMTILVRLMSYGDFAEENGGFPYGYNRIAASVGLADGLSVGSGQLLKEHDIIKLLYNAINAPFAQIDYITNDGIVYKTKSDKSLLYELRGIYELEGVVEATRTAALRADEAVSGDMIRISGYTYATDKDWTDLLGMNVVAYVKENKAEDDTVAAIVASGNTEIVVYDTEIVGPASDFKSFEYYDEKGRPVRLSVNDMAAVLWNGQPLSVYTREAFMPKDGFIRFINNDGKAGYDVVDIMSFKTIVVESVSKFTKTIHNMFRYDEDNLTLEAEEKNEDIIRLFDESGELELSNIAEGDVIRAAKSVLNGRAVVEAYVSHDKVSGVASGISSGDEARVTVDGVEYALSAYYEEALENNEPRAIEIKAGGSYVFSLDDMGKIAFVSDAEGMEQYGIVYAIAAEGALTQKYNLKVFTSSGEWKIYPLAEKVTLDGERTSADNAVSSIKCSKDGNLGLTGYTLNNNGEISDINTPEVYNDGNNGRFNNIERFSEEYRQNNASFDSEVFIKDSCTMWFVNVEDLSDEKSYMLGAKNLFQNDEACTVRAYNLNEAMFADLFIIERSSTTIQTAIKLSDLFVVDEVSQVIKSNGELANKVSGKIGVYEKFSYYCEDESILDGISKGDVVSFHTDIDGNIDAITKYRSLSDGEVYTNPSAMHSIATVLQGKITDQSPTEKWIKVDCGGERTRIVRTAKITSVIIYDTERDELYNGTLSDIEKGDLVTTKLKWSNATTLVVYKAQD